MDSLWVVVMPPSVGAYKMDPSADPSCTGMEAACDKMFGAFGT